MATNNPSLQQLQQRVDADLNALHLPAHRWILHHPGDYSLLDVAVIGGGMAGMAVGFGLMKEGVCRVEIFDDNPRGEEGPWETSARMDYLRSSKTMPGPAMGIASLTFQSWYQAVYGETAWEQLDLVPTADWAAYLRWYREATHLPIRNEMVLQEIRPVGSNLELMFDHLGSPVIVYAHKVVLATGRKGFGGVLLPPYADQIPKNFCAHTADRIDTALFPNKTIVVVGAGASAFDAAGTALEYGAKEVHMLIRRDQIPIVNRFARFSFAGILHGFYSLSDQARFDFFREAFCCGIPPSVASVERVSAHDNIYLHFSTQIETIDLMPDNVILNAQKENISADFIIFATGYTIEPSMRPEFYHFIDAILLWEDRIPRWLLAKQPKLGRFPYLGGHFQFLEKKEGIAPELKNIYCFNYGAFLSHGLVSGDIPGLSVGATRLVEGIVSDLFTEDYKQYLQMIRNYSTPLFSPEDYKIFRD